MQNELAQAYGSLNQETNEMASQGRKGDAMMAHVTPGDYVIPKDILVQHPDFLVKLKKVMADEHEDYRTHMVGSGFENINPETGAAEFGFGKAIGKAFKNVSNVARGALSVGTLGGSEGQFGNPAAVGKGMTNLTTAGFRGGDYGNLNPKEAALPALPAYSPSNMALPGSLQELGGLTNLQRRSYLATQGSQGEGLGGSGAEYYANLLQRNIQANPDQSLLPVESQYLNQHGVDTNLHGQALIEALRGF